MQFITFLVDYWKYISIGLVVILDIVLILIKRRPKTLDDFALAVSEVSASISEFVCFAELREGSGAEKKDCAINLALIDLGKKLRRHLSDGEIAYAEGLFSKCIESVLTTPTKKGGIGREEIES